MNLHGRVMTGMPGDQAQHRIASTNPHPMGMDTPQSAPHGACGVAWSRQRRAKPVSPNDVEVEGVPVRGVGEHPGVEAGACELGLEELEPPEHVLRGVGPRQHDHRHPELEVAEA